LSVVLLWLLGVGVVFFAPVAHADGGIPPGCSMVQGIVVCTDSSTGSTGSSCVTDDSTGTQTCLTGSGGLSTGTISPLGRGLGSVLGTPAQTTSTGWLSRLTGWISYAINQFFGALVQFLKDLVTYVLSVILGVVQSAIAAIPVPSWLADNSLGNLLGQTGSIVGFFMSQLRIPQALTVIAAGYAFRLFRKFVTLFQW
jgi:hypothetical protein